MGLHLTGSSVTQLNNAYVGQAALQNPKLWAPSPYDSTLTWLTTFATGHGWLSSVAGTSTVDLANTERLGPGPAAPKVVVPSGGGNAIVYKTGLTLDLSTNELVVPIWTDAASSPVQITAYSSATEGYALVTASTGDIAPQWVMREVPIEAMAPFGAAPNRASIIKIEVTFFGSSPGTYYLGGVGLRPKSNRFPNGALMLCFDDNYSSAYTLARVELAKRGLAGTCYVIADTVGTTNHTTLAQLQELQDIHGWCIAAHSNTLAAHDNRWSSLTDAQVEAEAAGIQKYLRDNGFSGWRHFAAPGGVYTPSMSAIDSTHFTTQRRSGNLQAGVSLHHRPTPLTPAWLDSASITSANIASVDALVASAMAAGALMSINFHDFTTNPSPTDFSALLDQIQARGIPVVTPLDLYERNTGAPTKTSIGLGNVDNTSDASKPVSTAQQAAIDAKGTSTTRYTTAQTNTTYTIPTTATRLRIRVLGSGGGGGSGRRGAAGTIRCGGGGGGAGGYAERDVLVSELGQTTLVVTVGAAGGGGTGVATDDTDGAAGTAGGASSVALNTGGTVAASISLANGGSGGGGGTATSGTAGAGGLGKWAANSGAAASSSGGAGSNGASGNANPGSGAGGGGVSAGNAASAGGSGGPASGTTAAFSTAGTSGGGAGAAGSSPTALAPGQGGAGGGSSITGTGGAGGAGGRGGGGGGGGAALNGAASGAGGAGGIGFVEITAWA